VDAVRWSSIDSENRIRCPGKSGRNVGRNQVIGARHSDGVDYHVDGCARGFVWWRRSRSCRDVVITHTPEAQKEILKLRLTLSW